MRHPDEMVDRFRERGLKVTPQRELIFRLVHGNSTHPTAEAIWAQARQHQPMMSLKTVYQTLNDLAEMGELQLLDVGTGSGRFDPEVAPHGHLVCSRCGAVRDVPVDPGRVVLPGDDLGGFTVARAEVTYRGTCADCAAA